MKEFEVALWMGTLEIATAVYSTCVIALLSKILDFKGLFICEPKFLAPSQNFGLEFWPGTNKPNFRPEIPGKNFKQKFQAKIPI